ncbi:hypothetical protein FA95DRAFT_1491717 [Auriscalpium vulgare]|uniref:Uncharacterized protein n=1 Tax=Auriscalpium vulgare TaxID=40419 RepID=A0ACB8RVF4_9AGAM|nr:hypothetical protein FA95DRAFT_1491717 [Auriscalpium vulgare]
MNAAGPGQEEREARDFIRRAERAAPGSALRKNALLRLIELAHSPHSALKKLAANNLTKFFKDFPDRDEDAINAVYDLCEDQDPQIRIDGYKAIVQMSKEQPKWVKRNADVLVQLLQSAPDEPDEVLVVKRALTAHLDMDAKVTLGVLCDQIVPPDEPVDEEDKAIRERLRSLVVAFMAGEARQAIIERHASQRGSEPERTLITGLFKAVRKFGRTDGEKIVKDILIYLPSFKGEATARGNELLQIILDQARSCLKEDLSAGGVVPLERTRHFLDLAIYLSLERRTSDSLSLLRFFCTSGLLGKFTLHRLSPDAQIFVIVGTAECLAACVKAPERGDSAPLRKQVIDASAILLPLFVTAKPSDARSWNACEVLLAACQLRKENESWNVPTFMIPCLEDLNRLAGEQRGLKLQKVQNLTMVRSFVLASALRPPTALLHRAVRPLPGKPPPTATAALERSPLTAGKRKAEDEGGPPPSRPRAESISIRGQHAREQPPHVPAIRRQSIGMPPSSAAANLSLSSSMKRLKTSPDVEDAKPSLLSRMGNKNGAPPFSPGALPPRPVSAQPMRTVARPEPLRGISIKGAASAEFTGRNESTEPRSNSLLARMQDDGDGVQRKWKKKA